MLNVGIDIRGIAHITGGGFIENIPRVLPSNLDAEIKKGTWPMLPLFSYIQKAGNVPEEEMYRVFNMSIGLVLIVPYSEKEKIETVVKEYPDFSIFEIGKIVPGKKEVILK
jgi:phosphoribosylformylglycinamidine cyclo-ligase